MAEQSDQDKESKGGLPGLEWVLKHQGWFLVVAIPTSFLVTVAVIKYAVIPLVEESLAVKGTANNVGGFTDTPVLSLALLVASITFAVTIWRGYQTYEQIRKAREQIDEAQKQFNQARFQNALQMATEKENAGRCISGLRVLEDMYEDLIFEEDKETVHSVALYVLSLPKPDKDGKIKRVSLSARQRALDILVNKRFLSQEKLEKSNRERGSGQELPVRDSMIEKDLTRLYLARRSKEEDSNGKKTLNLSWFSFRGCDFSCANLSNVNFNSADFTDAKLYGTNLSDANLVNVVKLSDEYLYQWAYCLRTPITDEFGPHEEPKKVKTWYEWKLLVSIYDKNDVDVEHGPIKLDEEMWDYMKRLVQEDATFPPGVNEPI